MNFASFLLACLVFYFSTRLQPLFEVPLSYLLPRKYYYLKEIFYGTTTIQVKDYAVAFTRQSQLQMSLNHVRLTFSPPFLFNDFTLMLSLFRSIYLLGTISTLVFAFVRLYHVSSLSTDVSPDKKNVPLCPAISVTFVGFSIDELD